MQLHVMVGRPHWGRRMHRESMERGDPNVGVLMVPTLLALAGYIGWYWWTIFWEHS